MGTQHSHSDHAHTDHGRADHSHDHGGHHHHAPKVSARNVRAVGLAALLTGAFMIAEVVGGVISGSLALIADAGHMLTDFAALALAWLAFRIAQRPSDWKRSYGFDRFSVLAAFVNGLSLFLIAAWIIYEAAHRIADPQPVLAGPMLAIAVLGLLVNLVALQIMRSADPDNLNIRAAMLHVMGDLLGSVAAIAAAGIIMATSWFMIDPLLSVLVALIILRGAWAVTRSSAHILLQGAPDGLEPEFIATDLKSHVTGVTDVHHIHSWSLTEERPVITLHARIADGLDSHAACRAIKIRLAEKFDIGHATVEIEQGEAECEDQSCG
ncbi:cation diffusion facilitator family transporter [Sphingorhabdus sp. Alg239-R122]|uniref:cation diffusion facilitator family transporter n=1 Tax=Sphingorhabdus sp. Alg239-R122 TaxID=2305989 RepID=UPI0013DA9E17|nr:cation diffusion facilitator family transporter [Sphingorhabdus sp. Alg239-R122]